MLCGRPNIGLLISLKVKVVELMKIYTVVVVSYLYTITYRLSY